MSTYCDSCWDSAMEEGEPFGIEDPEMILSSMADLLPDHACDRMEDQDIECQCNAHRSRKVILTGSITNNRINIWSEE